MLANPSFGKTITTMFGRTIEQTIKPVEKGSELEQMGFKMYHGPLGVQVPLQTRS